MVTLADPLKDSFYTLGAMMRQCDVLVVSATENATSLLTNKLFNRLPESEGGKTPSLLSAIALQVINEAFLPEIEKLNSVIGGQVTAYIILSPEGVMDFVLYYDDSNLKRPESRSVLLINMHSEAVGV